MYDTEKRNPRTTHIDKMETLEMVRVINDENRNSVEAVEKALPQIAQAVDAVANAFEQGGRLFYLGAGTSGRIAVMDAAECPPTFGVSYDQVIAVMAGGARTMTKAAEGEEDNGEMGKQDLLAHNITEKDVVMGISASGNAAYVESAILAAKELGCVTISLSCNRDCKIAKAAQIVIVTETGPEVITGSTRMKAGNAQKFVLNMITTGAMVKTGKVYENLMINLRPTNIKLKDRMVRIVCDILECDRDEAVARLDANDWVIRKAIQ